MQNRRDELSQRRNNFVAGKVEATPRRSTVAATPTSPFSCYQQDYEMEKRDEGVAPTIGDGALPLLVSRSRRAFLKRSATAGALLAAGLWPGCARRSGNGRGGNFTFAVVNDTHFQSPQCPAWFERVNASIRSQQPRPEFCLVVGDLAEHGTAAELGAMRELLQASRIEFHPVIGNHDSVTDTDRSAWDALFPNRLNYHFEHRGWQFVGLDTSEGKKSWTTIQPGTFAWLDENLSKLDPAAPTVMFTHFPLGIKTVYRPTNADDLLARFESFNLVNVFNGHYHGFSERHAGRTTLTTNRCCAISRANHDKSPEKGYFLCTAKDGLIQRQFIQVETDGLSA